MLSLIVTSLNRGTLHLVRTEDYSVAASADHPAAAHRDLARLAQEGVPPEEAERAVRRRAGGAGRRRPAQPLSLRERIAAAGVRTEGQAMVHILALASIRG